MPIAISCPKCNRKYKVRDELAGKTAKCSCGQSIVIPKPPANDLSSLLDEDLGVVAPGDPLAGLAEDAASPAMPLQPVKTRKKSFRIKVSPKLIWVLAAGGGACILFGGLIYLVMGLFASPPPRWNSPEEVFKAGSKAANENDWKAYFETIAPASQTRLAQNALLGAMTAAEDMAVFKDICTRYGVAPVSPRDITSREKWNALEDRARAAAANMSAAEQSNLFVDTAKILADEDKLPMMVPRGISSNIKFFSFAKGAKSCVLADLRIEGFRASAVREYHSDSGDVITPLERTQFVKVGGEWRQVFFNAEENIPAMTEQANSPSAPPPPGSSAANTQASGGGNFAGPSRQETENEKQARYQSINNLKQFGLGVHNYTNVNHHNFPPAYSVDKNGKPLLSWRVLILPFIGEEGLYQQFHLDEPWDSAHNKTLLAQMPAVYQSPGSAVAGQGKTNYLAVRGKDTVFSGEKANSFSTIKDSTSFTIMIVEVADSRAVEWTRPNDFEFNPLNPIEGLVGLRLGCFLALVADGSARSIPSSVSAEKLKGWFNISDGQTPDFD